VSSGIRNIKPKVAFCAAFETGPKVVDTSSRYYVIDSFMFTQREAVSISYPHGV
jgi:hypothetical protein